MGGCSEVGQGRNRCKQKGDSSLKRESVKGSEERDRVWLMLLGPLNAKNMYYELNSTLLKRCMCVCDYKHWENVD